MLWRRAIRVPHWAETHCFPQHHRDTGTAITSRWISLSRQTMQVYGDLFHKDNLSLLTSTDICQGIDGRNGSGLFIINYTSRCYTVPVSLSICWAVLPVLLLSKEQHCLRFIHSRCKANKVIKYTGCHLYLLSWLNLHLQWPPVKKSKERTCF